MPNHVTNILTISGPEEEVTKFRVKVSTENPDLIKLYMDRANLTIKRYEETEDKTTLGFDAKSDYERAQGVVGGRAIVYNCFTFEGTIPMPLELEGTVEGSNTPDWQDKITGDLFNKYGACTWYQFNTKAWGTKWDAYDVQEVKKNDDGSFTYTFDTAWCPPGFWLETTAKMFPTLTFNDAWRSEGGESGVITLCEEEGINEREDMNEEDWLLTYDENCKEEYEFITQGKYAKVIKKYAKGEEPERAFLEKYLLKRIKDEDLPLFMNYVWFDEYKDEYVEKMDKLGQVINE
jgi:hypothetical protein